MRNPSTRRARTVRTGAIAIVCAAGALAAALPAQAAWLVSDTEAQRILRQIEQHTSSDGLYELTRDFRDKEQPNGKWNGTGHRGSYKPYTSSKREGADYGYDMLAVTLNNRSRTEGMQEKCRTTTATDVPDNELWQPAPLPTTGSDPQADQLVICRRLVVSENLRFNEYRRMLQRIKDRNDALKRMSDQRTDFSDSGTLSADSNNLQMFIADSQVEIQYSQAVIAAYDAQIVRLKEARDMQAQRALDGPPKASGALSIDLGSIARAGTLCLALTAFQSSSSDFSCTDVADFLF